ncbi:MAG: NUDIX hydrolase [Desulfobacca sp. RBG_16_60_12]|nr:MAG: NUDIX hydrolase [Desulfobacca sp. RBG_16_60_12]
MQSWKTLSREIILDLGKFLSVETHTVELPDGRLLREWPWVITPDYVNVLAVTEDGEFLCFRQTKYAVEGTSLAPVGGYLDAGEDPLSAARRELLEETGCQAAEWVDLGRFPVDGNRGAGTAHLFLARGARRVAQASADDLEEQQLLRLSRSELEAALSAGEFKLLPWAAVVALALYYMKHE